MDDFGLWDVFVSIFWFMLLFAWIWLLISIFADIFRDHELSGWGKALWGLFIIVVPWLGALVYLIARGRSMNERSVAQAQVAESPHADGGRDPGGAGEGHSTGVSDFAVARQLVHARVPRTLERGWV